MKRAPQNIRLRWLLNLVARQFLISPAELRRQDRTAWKAAARDVFAVLALNYQFGTRAEIAAMAGRDPSMTAAAKRRLLADWQTDPDGLTATATRILSGRVSQELSRTAEMASKTPSETGFSRGRGGHTTRPPSLAPTPRPNAAYRNSTHPLTSSASE